MLPVGRHEGHDLLAEPVGGGRKGHLAGDRVDRDLDVVRSLFYRPCQRVAVGILEGGHQVDPIVVDGVLIERGVWEVVLRGGGRVLDDAPCEGGWPLILVIEGADIHRPVLALRGEKGREGLAGGVGFQLSVSEPLEVVRDAC